MQDPRPAAGFCRPSLTELSQVRPQLQDFEQRRFRAMVMVGLLFVISCACVAVCAYGQALVNAGCPVSMVKAIPWGAPATLICLMLLVSVVWIPAHEVIVRTKRAQHPASTYIPGPQLLDVSGICPPNAAPPTPPPRLTPR
jgi:hypothetical protein